MPALATLTLKDMAAANHVFKPRDIKDGTALFVESTGVPIGDKRVTVNITETGSNRRKATYKIVLPVVQDVTSNGVSRPTVVRTSYVDISFTFDGTSSSDERGNAVAFARSLLMLDSQWDPIVGLEPYW